MAGLTVEARTALAQVLESVPDDALNLILSVVRRSAGQRAREVEALLHDSIEDRRRRVEAFGAILPLFGRRIEGFDSLHFPYTVLPRLWQAVCRKDREALGLLERIGDDQETFRALGRSRLYSAALSALNESPESIWPSGADEAAWRDGVAELKACCAMGMLAHRAAANLSSWIDRPTEEQLAELKLALKDASDGDAEGPRRLIDILAAHLDRIEDVVRLVLHAASAMGHEAMLRHSELGLYVERALDVLEQVTLRLLGWRPGEARHLLERDLATAGAVVAALDRAFAHDPQGDWAHRLASVKGRIVGMIEDRLQATTKAVSRVLPMRHLQTAGRMSRKAADPNAIVDEGAWSQARGLIDLAGAVRSAAAKFGCEARRQVVVEGVITEIVPYIDQMIEAVHAGQAENDKAATARMMMLADLLESVGDDAEARTARRRISALGGSDRVQAA